LIRCGQDALGGIVACVPLTRTVACPSALPQWPILGGVEIEHSKENG
jgi:hypothetical protein